MTKTTWKYVNKRTGQEWTDTSDKRPEAKNLIENLGLVDGDEFTVFYVDALGPVEITDGIYLPNAKLPTKRKRRKRA